MNDKIKKIPKDWKLKSFEKCLQKIPRVVKIPKKQFKKEGSYPIISQERNFINGYWNDKKDIFEVDKPVVIFGDHTKNIKFVDFDFVVGADGVKIFLPIKDINSKYFYYQLLNLDLKNLGYARHYRLLKEKEIIIPPLKKQKEIVAVLDNLNEQTRQLENNYQKELVNLQELEKVFLERAFCGEL